jgi:hypothetical protein
VEDILSVSLGRFGIDVDQHQLAHQPLQHECVRSRAADETTSDNSCFHGLSVRILIA